MTSPNRAKGDRHERATRELLIRHRWFVVRAAGSHGIADLVAMRGDSQPWLISCKAIDDHPYLPPKEWGALFETAMSVNAIPVLCYRRTHIEQSVHADRRPAIHFVALMAPARGKGRLPPVRALDYH